MKTNLFLVISCAAFATPAIAFSQNAATATRPAAPRPPDFKSLSNGAIHILRAAQKSDGSYGGSVAATGLSLYGFAKCGRQYREADGPFVINAVQYILTNRKADGSFNGDDTNQSTLAAALALDALDKVKYKDQVEAAVAFVAKATGKTAPAGASGASLENYAFETVPALIGELPSEPMNAAAYATNGLDPAKNPADAMTAARKLVITNIASTRIVAPPKPQELPPTPLPAWNPTAKTDLDATIKKGVEFLLKRQSPDGSFGTPVTKDQLIGVTALVTQAVYSYPGERPAAVSEAAAKATKIVAGAARPNGAIHGGGMENYTTSASIGALAASGNAEYKDIIAKARKYISDLQGDEGEGYNSEHPYYGGFGYGDEERPDMSNTNFALDALRAAGAGADDPAMQKALKFLERCQNRSETNTTEISRDGIVAVAGNDGGGIYFPGKSQAGSNKSADGKKEIPRSYGSMTYALVKGFVFAGLTKEDPRLKAAYDWCKKNYTLDHVPGYEEMAKASPRIAYQGLFYYYLTMATALKALGDDVIETPDGQKHDWRAEMASRLASMQKPDGAWTNDNAPRWWEGDEIIATAYAVLTLNALKK